jgi:putative nucleotidyltransferase with HDIG domain
MEFSMGYGITREEAVQLLKEHIKNPNLYKHCLASEAVMGALADRLGEDREKWSLAGLLHDLDVEAVHADLSRHTYETERILLGKGVDAEIVAAIKMHNEKAHGATRSERFHHALAAGETITGLIIATTLVYPDKKLSSVKAKSVKKRMKEKAFAAGVDREIIMECEKLGIGIDEFCELCVKAMQGISGELGF